MKPAWFEANHHRTMHLVRAARLLPTDRRSALPGFLAWRSSRKVSGILVTMTTNIATCR
jgi:hypothetical protein